MGSDFLEEMDVGDLIRLFKKQQDVVAELVEENESLHRRLKNLEPEEETE